MKCIDCIDRFDDSLDGRLQADEEEILQQHLGVCRSCADEFESVRDLRERAAELPRSLEPTRDLWPGIASEIDQSKVVRGRFGRRALLAAAAAVLVVSSVITAYFLGRSQAVVTAEAPVAAANAPSAVLLASFDGLGVEGFAARRTELLDALEARNHELSPETMDVVMENLRMIDQAMDRIAVALGEDPENEFLMKRLAGAYRQQINLLQRAVRLPSEV
jgi:anti-sigma factor RsiW